MRLFPSTVYESFLCAFLLSPVCELFLCAVFLFVLSVNYSFAPFPFTCVRGVLVRFLFTSLLSVNYSHALFLSPLSVNYSLFPI